jgi:hypothetical protein
MKVQKRHSVDCEHHSTCQQQPDLLRNSYKDVRFVKKKLSICIQLVFFNQLPVPSSVWSNIAMDLVEGFPQAAGKSVVLTVVDRFLKYVHFIALGHPYTDASVAKVFLIPLLGYMAYHVQLCLIEIQFSSANSGQSYLNYQV